MPESKPQENILIVDDTPQNVDTMIGFLAHLYNIQVATHGQRALEIAATRPQPDLILLDIMMPGMDGYETCRRLKADKRTRAIPVIFVTAMEAMENECEGFDAGAVDYIQKPVSAPILLARVATHLRVHRQQVELACSYASLKDAESMRDSLMNMIIHDMRSPLMSISLGIEILSENLPKDDPDRKYASMATNATRTLNEMACSLLDIHRMEEGKLELRRSTCDLRELAATAVEEMKGSAEILNVTLDLSGANTPVFADKSLLHRVFLNLISNALKFTPWGEQVDIKILERNGHARVEISDKGPGISPAYHQTIFEKFGQVEMRQNKEQHSTGLGLTFCKLVTKAHGGKIGVESEPGHGATFWFELPRTPPPHRDVNP